MNRPTQALLRGIALAAFVLAGGAYNHYRLIRVAATAKTELPKIEAASRACYKRYHADHPYTGPGIPIDWVFAQSAECGTVLSATDLDERLQVDLQRSDHWTRRLAIVMLAMFATPWLWYFLLRRAAELGAAIRGKPPSS